MGPSARAAGPLASSPTTLVRQTIGPTTATLSRGARMSIELRDHEETAGRDGWMVLVMTFSAFAMIVMLFAAGVAVRGGDGGDGAPTVGETIDVTLGDLFVEPSSLTMPANSTLTLNVTNDGAMAHDLKVQGTEGTQMLEPGASETITIGPFDASTERSEEHTSEPQS